MVPITITTLIRRIRLPRVRMDGSTRLAVERMSNESAPRAYGWFPPEYSRPQMILRLPRVCMDGSYEPPHPYHTA